MFILKTEEYLKILDTDSRRKKSDLSLRMG